MNYLSALIIVTTVAVVFAAPHWVNAFFGSYAP